MGITHHFEHKRYEGGHALTPERFDDIVRWLVFVCGVNIAPPPNAPCSHPPGVRQPILGAVAVGFTQSSQYSALL